MEWNVRNDGPGPMWALGALGPWHGCAHQGAGLPLGQGLQQEVVRRLRPEVLRALGRAEAAPTHKIVPDSKT